MMHYLMSCAAFVSLTAYFALVGGLMCNSFRRGAFYLASLQASLVLAGGTMIVRWVLQ